MRYSASQTMRFISALLVVASLLISLIVRVTVASAETGSERAVEIPAANPLPATGKTSDEAVSTVVDPSLQARVKNAYGQLPLSFEANRGQADAAVKFLSRSSANKLFLTPTGAVWTLPNEDDAARDDRNQPSARIHTPLSVLRMKLAGANPEAQLEGEDQLPGRSNYLKGNDPRKWQKNVPHYAKVRYTEIYTGIDLLYYGNQQQLEYDFIVAPFADPKVIALDFEGVDHLSLDVDGNLVLHTRAGEVVQHAPVIYQETDGLRQTVSGHYIIKNEHEVGFEVAAYDRSRPLMIDPVVQFSTFLGGKKGDFARGVAVDTAGNAYVTGTTESIDFPRENAFDPVLSGESEAFITKFNIDGSALVYSTLIGGNFKDSANGIAVTKDGKACITGRTDGLPGQGVNTFPVTPNSLLGTDGSNKRERDAFVVVLNTAGDDLVYSSFFGGSGTVAHPLSSQDDGRAIAVDAAGNVYITGFADSFNLPTKNAFQFVKGSAITSAADSDAYIAKFNPQASTGPASLLYASYLGGREGESGNGIAVDKFGVAYVVGSTFSNNFPTKSPSSLPPFQKNNPGRNTSAFVAKINPAQSGNSSLIYSTYLGGSEDERARAVAVDAQQRTYITGSTESPDFPLKNPFDNTFANNDADESNAEAFVVKMNADGTALFYSSFLGGDGPDDGNGIAVDAQGNAYVAGETESETGFPILNAFQPNKGAFNDAFVTKISAVPSTSVSPQILFSSFLGGNGAEFSIAMAIGPKRSVFVTGATGSNTFPTTPGAFQQTSPPDFDAFLTRIAEVNDDTIGTFRPSDLIFRLRNSNTTGSPDLNVGPNFYQAGDLPVVGDFNGDGIDTTGIFRAVNANAVFLLSDKVDGSVTTGVFFGQAGDLPIAGDWDGDGKDGIGVFRPSAGKFFLRNEITPGQADFTITFGAVGDIPLAGDWDGDGDDTIGIYRDSQHKFFLRNKLNAGADINVQFGIAGDIPLTGDWDGDGDDTIGVFRNSNHKFFLRDDNNGAANLIVDFGATGDTPLAGDWDGLSSSAPPNSGVNDPDHGSSRAGEAQLFTTTCSDPDGWRNIHTIDFRIAKPDSEGNLIVALWAQFDQNRKLVRLYDPDTQTWDEGVPGANLILSNRFVRLRLGGSMVEGSGPDGPSVQITWNVVFEDAAAMDDYKQYLRIEDDAGFSTGFDEVGSWSVKQ